MHSDTEMFVERLQELIDIRAPGKDRSRLYTISCAAGLGRTYLHDLLTRRNQRPSLQAVQAIAKVLGTSVAYLIGETDRSAHREPSPGGDWPYW